ncbi:MAG: tetratricopeptide repeat protein [Treponema sp.]|jgi:tetratricopeptide (TPR) repeat protein|nr:tetratricopeptide repeat protein [Treponema sp.]
MTSRASGGRRFFKGRIFLFFSGVLVFVFSSCVSLAVAEDYYALGTGYFDLGKYAEAEKWFEKSKFNEKTKMASMYNLGRISFELGSYDKALNYFEIVIKEDPENLTALKAAAYTCVKKGDAAAALDYYRRAAELVPESGEDRYNYALLLDALGMYAEAETALGAPRDDGKTLLLLARVRKSLGKPEAIDAYSAYLEKTDDPAVRFEFAETLEEQKLYARALEQYSRLAEASPDSQGSSRDGENPPPEKSLVLFRVARVLLASDPADEKGLAALEEAVKNGYAVRAEIDAVLETARMPEEKKQELRNLFKT